MKVYISGPMTGLPEYNFPYFDRIAAEVQRRGHTAVNPAEINRELHQFDHPREFYLRRDLKELCDCDAILLLDGWESSIGANLELHVAHRLGMQVLLEYRDLEKL